MTAEELWREFCRKKGVDESTSYEAWAFCGGGPVGDELAGLVLAGTKSATASCLLIYEQENEPLPQVGSYSVLLYDNGEAACVIRNTKVSVVPFGEVSEEHAYREGEGARTLEEWRDVHRRFFAQEYQALGFPFEETSCLCVLEEFERVYP